MITAAESTEPQRSESPVCTSGPYRLPRAVQRPCLLDLLLALNSGLPGMASLHANSAREALVKMCTLPLLAGEH